MKVGILGVGLLGGSIGYILKEKQWAEKIIGIGRDEEKLKKAVQAKAIDEFIVEIDEKISDLDIIILATPVKLMPKFVEKMLPFLKEGVILTDVGSTKQEISECIEKIIPKNIFFIGGHPMAGSEKTGVEALDPLLFENAIYILTKTNNTNYESLVKLKDMVKTLGANPLEMDIENHDIAVATISHMPHIIAASIVNCAQNIENKNKHVLSLAASGFRDTTRIAAGSPEMWRDICLTNDKKIIAVIDDLELEINKFKNAIKSKNKDLIEALFKKAKDTRDSLPIKKRNILPEMYELLVRIEDKPGVIGIIANLLGENNINIKSIEVINVNEEGESGRLIIGLEFNGNEENSVQILKDAGYKITVLK